MKNTFALKFQFPPNGKVLCKSRGACGMHYPPYIVSIPSERESALQDLIKDPTLLESEPDLAFQFPPNGKVLCKH